MRGIIPRQQVVLVSRAFPGRRQALLSCRHTTWFATDENSSFLMSYSSRNTIRILTGWDLQCQ